MKINEIINEGFTINPKESNVRKTFIDLFSQRVKQNQKAAKEAGVPFNAKKMVYAYCQKNRWTLDDEDKKILDPLCDMVSKETGFFRPNLKKLANLMYMIGTQSSGSDNTAPSSTPSSSTPVPTSSAPATPTPSVP